MFEKKNLALTDQDKAKNIKISYESIGNREKGCKSKFKKTTYL